MERPIMVEVSEGAVRDDGILFRQGRKAELPVAPRDDTHAGTKGRGSKRHIAERRGGQVSDNQTYP